MSNIPVEVIHDILLFVPTKSLLRFECLCKPLNAIIRSQSFAAKRSFRKLVLVKSDAFNTTGNVHVLAFDNSFKKETVFQNVSPKYHLIDECNGLFVLCLSSNKICVWNPSTGQRRVLPHLPFRLPYLMRLSIGYDFTTDDYKIVALRQGVRVRVFSLKSGLWRKAPENFPYDIRDPYELGHGSCFADGALHFLCKGKIVAFNVATEMLSIVDKPIKHIFGINMHCFGGHLSVEIFAIHNIELYIRKKDADDFTWIKLYSFQNNNLWTYKKVIGYLEEKNKILMQENGKMNSCHLKDGVIEQIPIKNRNKKMQIKNAFLCSESFVSI